MENHQTVARPHNGTPGWWATELQLILILKQHQIFRKFPISINFTYPLRKTIYFKMKTGDKKSRRFDLSEVIFK